MPAIIFHTYFCMKVKMTCPCHHVSPISPAQGKQLILPCGGQMPLCALAGTCYISPLCSFLFSMIHVFLLDMIAANQTGDRAVHGVHLVCGNNVMAQRVMPVER